METRYKPAVFASLPPGTYTVQGVYRNDSDGLADGAPAAALVGQIAGNTLRIEIPAEKKPAKDF